MQFVLAAGTWPNPSARSCPVESCVTASKILRLMVVQGRGALFQSVHSLNPDRSLRAESRQLSLGQCESLALIRSQGSLPSPAPLAPAISGFWSQTGRCPDYAPQFEARPRRRVIANVAGQLAAWCWSLAAPVQQEQPWTTQGNEHKTAVQDTPAPDRSPLPLGKECLSAVAARDADVAFFPGRPGHRGSRAATIGGFSFWGWLWQGREPGASCSSGKAGGR
ncbi:MAG: transposase [Arthrobacter sp.]|nr:transposase [Arthrobacter sp.]MCU1552982.1 transposase [Arthrobacter sp.]